MRLFNSDGKVALAERQGKPQKIKNVNGKNEGIEICLNCKKKKCSGYCEIFREGKNDN